MRVLVLVWLGLLSFLPGEFVRGEGEDSDPLNRLIDRLLSEDETIREEARDLLEKWEGNPVQELMNRISSSEDAEGRKLDTYRVGIVLSPWLQGEERSARFLSAMRLRRPGFPVERVAGKPEAPMVRAFLQERLESAFLEAGRPVDSSDEEAFMMQYHLKEEIAVGVGVLGEVADASTIDWAFAELEKMEDPALGDSLMVMIDSVLGLRPAFRSSLLCGNSSAEGFERFRANQNKAFQEAKAALLNSWNEIRVLAAEERHSYLVKHWRDYFVPKQEGYSGSFFHSKDWIYEELEPLIRQGEEIVPAVREQQAKETTLEAKAVWEVVVTAITGQEDEVLVRELLDRKRDTYWKYTCEILAASRGARWLAELEELQKVQYFDTSIASGVLASVHREEGLDALKRGLEFRPNSPTAKYAIEEIEAREALELPKVIPGWQFAGCRPAF